MTRWMAFRLYWWDVGQSAGLRFADWCERHVEQVDPNRRRKLW